MPAFRSPAQKRRRADYRLPHARCFIDSSDGSRGAPPRISPALLTICERGRGVPSPTTPFVLIVKSMKRGTLPFRRLQKRAHARSICVADVNANANFFRRSGAGAPSPPFTPRPASHQGRGRPCSRSFAKKPCMRPQAFRATACTSIILSCQMCQR